MTRRVHMLVALACLLSLMAGCGRVTEPESEVVPQSRLASTPSTPTAWVVTQLSRGGGDACAGQDAVAWTTGPEQPLVHYLEDGSDEASTIATTPRDASVSDLLISGKSVFWVVETDLPSGTTYELFTWSPGDGAPRRLASSREPARITDLQVVGTRVLFSSGPDGRDVAGKTEDDSGYNPVSDSSNGWRMLDTAHPATTRRLDFGPAGAEAILGDGFVAWIEPVGDWRIRYRSFEGGLRLGSTHSVANPRVGRGGPLPEAFLLQASGGHLAWTVRTDVETGNGDRIASWRLGDSHAVLVPGSADFSELALGRGLVAWVDIDRTGVFTWRPGDAERSVLSTAPGGWGVSTRGDSVLYAALRDGQLSLSRWDRRSGRSEPVWHIPAAVEEADYSVYAYESERRIIFTGSYQPAQDVGTSDDDDWEGEIGTMLATRR